MYVSEKDIDTLNAMVDNISNLIEGGAEGEYWQELSANAHKLFDKAKYSHYKQKNKRSKNRPSTDSNTIR
jgi:uncharacterized linocin/CFP29 family protein